MTASRAVACVLGLGIALGCGSGDRGARTHHVEIQAMQFVPAEPAVAVGDTVVWTNRDVVPHTVTSAPASPATFDSQQLVGQQPWRYTVTVAGELPYVCTFHPTMRGRLIAK